MFEQRVGLVPQEAKTVQLKFEPRHRDWGKERRGKPRALSRALPRERGALRGAAERWLRPGAWHGPVERGRCANGLGSYPFARISYRIVINSIIIKLQK